MHQRGNVNLFSSLQLSSVMLFPRKLHYRSRILQMWRMFDSSHAYVVFFTHTFGRQWKLFVLFILAYYNVIHCKSHCAGYGLRLFYIQIYRNFSFCGTVNINIVVMIKYPCRHKIHNLKSPVQPPPSSSSSEGSDLFFGLNRHVSLRLLL